MLDEQNKSERILLDEITQSIKFFKEKARALFKIGSTQNPSEKEKLTSSLNEFVDSWSWLAEKYSDEVSYVVENWIVIQRYIARIREISNSFSEKTADSSLKFYFASLSNKLSNFKKYHTLYDLFYLVLLSLPRDFIRGQRLSPNKAFMPAIIPPTVKHQTQPLNSPIKVNYAPRQKKQNVYDCLNLEEDDYRRRVIRAKEQKTRNNRNLTEEVLNRNKYISLQLFEYRKNHKDYLSRAQKQKQRSTDKRKHRFVDFREDKPVYAQKLHAGPNKESGVRRIRTNLQKIFEESEAGKDSPPAIVKSLSSAKIMNSNLQNTKNGKSLARYLDKIHTNKVFHMTRVQILQTQLEDQKNGSEVKPVFPFAKKLRKRQFEALKKSEEQRKKNAGNFSLSKAKFIIKSMEALFLQGYQQLNIDNFKQ